MIMASCIAAAGVFCILAALILTDDHDDFAM